MSSRLSIVSVEEFLKDVLGETGGGSLSRLATTGVTPTSVEVRTGEREGDRGMRGEGDTALVLGRRSEARTRSCRLKMPYAKRATYTPPRRRDIMRSQAST